MLLGTLAALLAGSALGGCQLMQGWSPQSGSADANSTLVDADVLASPSLEVLLKQRPTPWILAQSLPLSGPSSHLGKQFSYGIDLVIRELNQGGGVAGRPVKIWRRDDGYEPAGALANTQAFAGRPEVLALFGYVGTPTTKAALPVAQASGLTLVAPLTGASVLRAPGQRNVAHYRSSYAGEAQQIVRYLINDGFVRIAIAYQDDAYGKDVTASLKHALRGSNQRPVAAVPLPRNSLDTIQAARTLSQSDLDALVVVSTSQTMASLIRNLKQMQVAPQVMTISFTGARALFDDLPRYDTFGIGVTHVVPFPWDDRKPEVAEYQLATRRFDPSQGFDFVSLEGYLMAKWVVKTMRSLGPNLSRQSLGEALLKQRGATADGQGSVGLVFLGTDPWGP